MCSQLLNDACDTICKQIVKEKLTKESGHHRLNTYYTRIHVVRRMFLLCCSKFTRTLDKSNRSSLSPSHHISFKIIVDLSQSPKLWTDICVWSEWKNHSIQWSVCVHEKNETKTHSYAHTYTNVWSCWKRESKIISLVWEPNENDWPNHFRLKIDVVDMKWIQYNCECVRSNREFVGVRVCVCDCDACCFIGVCMCKTEQSFLSVKATD